MLLSSGSSLSAGAIHTSKVELSIWHTVSWGRQKHNHKKEPTLLYNCVCTCGDALWSLTTRVGCCTEFSSVPVKFKVIPPLEVWDTDTALRAYGGLLLDCSTNQLTYAGMVFLGVTEKKVGSLMKVNLTPSPVILALAICTTTELVEGRSELLPV